jgi:bifunctional DNA-binding transcriptional regulator/antitoxin component of YhaV-PrlF toxin-antitoxin module
VRVYAQNEGTPANIRDKFKITLRDIIEKILMRHEVIIARDLNGREAKTWQPISGSVREITVKD